MGFIKNLHQLEYLELDLKFSINFYKKYEILKIFKCKWDFKFRFFTMSFKSLKTLKFVIAITVDKFELKK